MSKIIIAVFVLNFVFGLQSSSCNSRDTSNNQAAEIFNINSQVELLFFYKKDISREEKDYFYENIFMKNSERGYYPRDGVKAVFGIDKNGYEGFGIAFRSEAAKEQRESIKKILKDSTVVYKVYENVIPNEIKDL